VLKATERTRSVTYVVHVLAFFHPVQERREMLRIHNRFGSDRKPTAVNSSALLINVCLLASVGGPAWSYFSAVCWLYGSYLYDELKIPIGLVESDWAATQVEAWSSPRALEECGLNT